MQKAKTLSLLLGHDQLLVKYLTDLQLANQF